MTLPTHKYEPLLEAPGSAHCVLGNEAICRGAIEAGVGFVSGYPGTPSSEITDTMARLASRVGCLFQYAVNEKTALEMAFAASLAGARSLVAMKHLGLLVAGDPLSTIPYIGVRGGMVVVSAGDPSCHTSPNEQDQRYLGPMLHLPVLDPHSPEEARRMARVAFHLSETSQLPVLLRITTRVAHGRATIVLSDIEPKKPVGFRREPGALVPVPSNARVMRTKIPARLAAALREGRVFQTRHGLGPTGLVTQGAVTAVALDLLKSPEYAAHLSVFSVGMAHPLDENFLAHMLRSLDRVLIVEEMSPFLEHALHSLSSRLGIRTPIFGKLTGHLPVPFEIEPPTLEAAVRTLLGFSPKPARVALPLSVEPRPPILCAGCPHRATFVAARAAFSDDQLFFNDIGCYTLGFSPPHHVGDALLCMGAGFTLAAGVARVTGQRTVGVMGDSTFFHAGMPALLEAIKENIELVAVVLDNQVTAMTGFQESPSQQETSPASIEAVARALGATQVQVIDPYQLAHAAAAFRRARDEKGVSVIVARQGCPVHEARHRSLPMVPVSHLVEQNQCRKCGKEALGMRCSVPATTAFSRNLVRVTGQRQRDFDPEVAPCAALCPLGLCIQGYAGHIAVGEYKEALAHIVERLPLPESVCRVCDRPCESGCVRADIDETVGINDLKRFVVDWAKNEPDEAFSIPCEPTRMQQIAVVGAGPAGLSAAQELLRRGYQPVVFDAQPRMGGLLSRGIPNYRLPPDAVSRDIERLIRQGVQFRPNVRLGHNATLDEIFSSGMLGVILATGASLGKTLDLPGNPKTPLRRTAIDFLRSSADSPSDGPLHSVVVIGGGNAAIDASRTALRRGARSVIVVSLETRDELPAFAEEVHAAEREGVVFRPGAKPRSASDGIVEIEFLADEHREVLPADLLLFAVGHAVDPTGLEVGGMPLSRTQDGLLETDPVTLATSHPRVFAAGDMASQRRTVTWAMAMGIRAAWGLDVALRGPEPANARKPPPSTVDPPQRVPTRSPTLDRKKPSTLDPAFAVKSFAETSSALSEADARTEASRCLQCGLCGNCRACIEVLACPAFSEQQDRAFIEPTLCTACGACEAVCSNHAIGPGVPP